MTCPRRFTTTRLAGFRPPGVARLAGRFGAPLAATTVALVVLAGCGSSTAAPSANPRVGSAGTRRSTSSASTATPPQLVGTATPPQTVSAATAGFRLPLTLSRAVATPGQPGHLVVLGGLHDGERSTDAVLDVSLATGAVTVAARLPTPVHDAAGALLDGVPTVVGGGNSRDVAAIQQFHGGATSTVGHIPVASSDVAAAATSRGLVVVGGYDGSKTLDQVLLVTGRATVRRIGSLPVAVRYPALAVVGSGSTERVLVFGGESGGIATDAVQEIDPATGATRVVAHLPAPRTQASALDLRGTVFVFGGASSGISATERVFSDVLRWVPSSESFVAAGSLPYPISDAAATQVDGVGYLVGGESPARVATTIIVTPR